MALKFTFWHDAELTLGHFANATRGRREALGLTQREAARRAGIALPRWQNLENGHGKPTCKELLAVARTLGLTLDELLGVEAPAVVG